MLLAAGAAKDAADKVCARARAYGLRGFSLCVHMYVLLMRLRG